MMEAMPDQCGQEMSTLLFGSLRERTFRFPKRIPDGGAETQKE